MPRSTIDYLRHIHDELTYLQAQSRDLDQAAFLQDETLKRAFVRSIEIIGEAAKQMPKAVRDEYPQVQWRSIIGMRDQLAHHYFGIDYDIVWDVVTHKAPSLSVAIQQILKEVESE